MILTSADVDQSCCAFHQRQLSVADEVCGFRTQIDRQHHKVRLFQQVVHVLTVTRPQSLLILRTPDENRVIMKLLDCFKCCFLFCLYIYISHIGHAVYFLLLL